ncbi:MAG: methylmalonyl-CoA epimerase [Thermoplasmata archaeon]
MNVDHLGLAVRSLPAALPKWERLLGTSASTPEVVASQKVRVAFLEAGPTHIELLEPTSADSAIGRFLDARGEGMHHIAFSVPSVDRQLAGLAAHGERIIDRAGRPGARGRIVGFAHPAAFGGVLVEFVEHL